MHTVEVNTSYGIITATWRRVEGNMIEVQYADRIKPAQASDDDAVNDFVARDMLRGWIALDLKDAEIEA